MDEHIEHLLGSTVNIFNPVHIIKDMQVLTSFKGGCIIMPLLGGSGQALQ